MNRWLAGSTPVALFLAAAVAGVMASAGASTLPPVDLVPPSGGRGSPDLARLAGFPSYIKANLAIPPSSNNRVEFFADRAAFPALENMLAGARRSILISVYNWRMDETGLRIADLVARKARQGVEAHVMVDRYGQAEEEGDADLVTWLRAHGIDVRYYRRSFMFPRSTLHFSHRKLYLVDGDQAMTGGMNLGHDYEAVWHDLLVKVDGDAAGQMHHDWLHDWYWSGGGEIRVQSTPDRPYGTTAVAVIATSPHEPGRANEIHRVLIAGIRHARRRIWAVYPYWGDKELAENLGFAAKRGVDVRAIMPAKADVDYFQASNLFVARELVESGVKVRWYTKALLHAKYLVVDDLTAIGSSNADTSSFQRQQDLNILSADPDFTQRFVADVPVPAWSSGSRDVENADFETSWPQGLIQDILRALRRFL